MRYSEMSNEIARWLVNSLETVINGREFSFEVEQDINDVLDEFADEYDLDERWFIDYGFDTAEKAYNYAA